MANTKKAFRVSKELRDEILSRIKNEGVSVAQAATDHGLSPKTIYNWLGAGVKGQPTYRELSKLKKENKALLELVGQLTVKLSSSQKKS